MLISLLDIANIFLFGSGFLMLYTAYRDRKVLRGYNLLGTMLIVLADTFFLDFYVQEGYWLIVSVSILRNRGRKKA